MRDLDTLIQSYKIMLNQFLSKYNIIGAHMIYLFYLAMKYKKPEVFEKVFLDTVSYNAYIQSDLKNFVEQYFDNPWIKSTIAILSADTNLQNTLLRAFCDNKGESLEGFYKVQSVKANEVSLVCNNTDGDWNSTHPSFPIAIFKDKSMGNVIFLPDLLRWKKIKFRTYREHLHKQLEMFSYLTEPDSSHETII